MRLASIWTISMEVALFFSLLDYISTVRWWSHCLNLFQRYLYNQEFNGQFVLRPYTHNHSSRCPVTESPWPASSPDPRLYASIP